MREEELYAEDFMSPEEREKFWELIYEKISGGIKKGHSYIILFGFGELIGKPELDDSEEGYSLIIEDDQYPIFLKNYLIWCEDLERYEKCIEVKELLEKINNDLN